MSELVYVQSRAKFDLVGRIELDTRNLTLLPKKQFREISGAVLSGVFNTIEDKPIALFRHLGCLTLWVDGVLYEITEDVQSTWELKPGVAFFRLIRLGSTILELLYKPFQLRPLVPGDTTAFVDEESYDFVLFVHRVLSDSNRRAKAYEAPFR